jgi:protoporphyrinogen oxidase
MNIAIIGGGLTGLTAAYELTKRGHKVTLFERDKELGGLANGFRKNNWNWFLEKSYHHLFTNDNTIVSFMGELGIRDKLILKRPITANLVNGGMYQLDSPIHLLRFPGLSMIDKLRTGALVAFCKIYPFWQTLEGVTAKQLFTTVGGAAGWRVIWEPLMTGKFGQYDSSIAASWLWARIKKRTPSLYYIEGGFHTLITTLEKTIIKQGGKILLHTSVSSIKSLSDFDKILLTVPSSVAQTIVPQLQITPIPHLTAQTLILETDTPILKDVYWLNITDRTFPFLAVVAHTNFMDMAHYGNRHLTYIGNYLPPDHPYLALNKEQLLKTFLPYIKRLTGDLRPASPAGRFTIYDLRLFTAPFAQPVHQINYSKRAPRILPAHAGESTVNNVYLANMDSIYPWDRGTNYAVELGQKAAAAMIK